MAKEETEEIITHRHVSLSWTTVSFLFFSSRLYFGSVKTLSPKASRPKSTGLSRVIRTASIRVPCHLPHPRVVIPDTSPLSHLIRNPPPDLLANPDMIRMRHRGSARKRVPDSAAARSRTSVYTPTRVYKRERNATIRERGGPGQCG